MFRVPPPASQASDVCILFLGHRMSTKQSQWQREKVGGWVGGWERT